MLKITDLKIQSADKLILNGLNLVVDPGSIHAIMGPNGAGKSTLSKVLVRDPSVENVNGKISYCKQDLLAMDAQEAAEAGIFLSFQYPVAIPGLTNAKFLRMILNAKLKREGKELMDIIDFLEYVKPKMKALEMPDYFLDKAINDDFSGGEKKKNEILQLLLLEPKLIILDEIDSGLDIDSLQIIARAIKQSLKPEQALIMITHYQRLLNYLKPDWVHVLEQGQIKRSGGAELALELELSGYGLNKNSETGSTL